MTYFNQDVSVRHCIFFKTEELLEVFTTKQNFEEKEYNFLCHEEYYDASGTNFKRSRKEERYKTSITRECASLSVPYWIDFLPHKMATASCIQAS